MTEDTHWDQSNMIYGDDPNNTVPALSAIMQSSNLYVYCTNNPIRYIDYTGLYNRDVAVEYALLYSVFDDGNGPGVRFNSDCTNFVSYCLSAGGGMKMSDDWYFNFGVAGWLPGKGYVVKGSYSRTWSIAEDQFKAFTNCTGEFPNANYNNGPAICITESRWIADAISIYNIQPGDVIYWLDPNTKTMEHAAMIVSTDNGKIIYAQHDGDKNDGDLGKYFDTHKDPNDFQCAFVVRIRDDA